MRIHPVDRLGMIKARIAELEEEEAHWRDRVIALASGAATVSGRLYDASVSGGTKVSVDMDAVRKKVGERWLDRHTTRTPTTVVRVTARKRRRVYPTVEAAKEQAA